MLNKILAVIIYYSNLILTSFQRKMMIRYDRHMASDYFKKRRYYAGKITHLVDESNQYIAEKIISGLPFMAGRFGSTEVYNMEVFDLQFTIKYSNALDTLVKYSGFFPYSIEYAMEFKEIMKESCSQVDVMAFWNMFREAYYIKRYMKSDIYLTQLRFLEPWYSEIPWTVALKNKKVLVIHPFCETIRSQYNRREKLFKNKDMLPSFDLKTLKAIQTLAREKDERFETWFDALEYMYNEALKIDFDIALIGCGAYGFPLAAKLKKAGKQAIHMGGMLQILFGIKGRRWDDDPIVSKLYNEYWVRPGENEKPVRAESIENGCYW
ncbi:hypothetical protein CLRAG_38710 [Clostridium ragsdalei P11]|uniref:Uncharacterized protein n=1 Tax=Clostridium ragsdalei P11 TaxID=1353534 RepID=A0A1A6AIJ2_9CLOT|nr:hypothetical protein [Clostridium ragsdalei]OBR89894.1 hypothetical protein CLRAG_38710 [Clostridium ragsdalei P11]